MQPKLPIADCTGCPGRRGKLVPPETACGPARLAVIGEAPGRNELRERRPFIGASGRMLQRGLRTIGLRREHVHWTHAVPCEVEPDAFATARKCCAARLRAELTEASPLVIMPVGAHGLHSVLGRTKRPQILKWRGSVTPVTLAPERFGGSPQPGDSVHYAIPTVHPAFVMRSPQWGPVLEGDVARIGRVLANGWQPPEQLQGRRTVTAWQLGELRELLAQLRPVVGFDVETVGLGPTSTRLVCFALSDGPLTIVVPWTRDSAGMQPACGWRLTGEAVTAALRRRIAVTHNGPAFDHIVAARHGIHVAAWEDTLLLTHALASHMPKGLQHFASTWLDVGAWKEVPHTDRIEQLHHYNAQDTLYTVLGWQAATGAA